ncbi:hypothetical protein [Paraburkholderia hospita]|uniref:hypothetical protein n=1 Tax=Paraburkholderia hospita TaxID=169430 RepID=UPI001374999D|nr:hypothetical protein [Paraburkholderia hospita]
MEYSPDGGKKFPRNLIALLFFNPRIRTASYRRVNFPPAVLTDSMQAAGRQQAADIYMAFSRKDSLEGSRRFWCLSCLYGAKPIDVKIEKGRNPRERI